MRALQRELATACHTCTHLLSSRSVCAGRGRNRRTRTHLRLPVTSQGFHRRQEQLASAGHSSRLVRAYAESGGGGGGGTKGRAPTTSDDGNDSPPWNQYSLFGITIMLVSLVEKLDAALDYLLHVYLCICWHGRGTSELLLCRLAQVSNSLAKLFISIRQTSPQNSLQAKSRPLRHSSHLRPATWKTSHAWRVLSNSLYAKPLLDVPCC